MDGLQNSFVNVMWLDACTQHYTWLLLALWGCWRWMLALQLVTGLLALRRLFVADSALATRKHTTVWLQVYGFCHSQTAIACMVDTLHCMNHQPLSYRGF